MNALEINNEGNTMAAILGATEEEHKQLLADLIELVNSDGDMNQTVAEFTDFAGLYEKLKPLGTTPAREVLVYGLFMKFIDMVKTAQAKLAAESVFGLAFLEALMKHPSRN
jgi:hypothetical protein